MTSDVQTEGSRAKIDAITAEKIAESSIEPDWSTATMMCHGRFRRSSE